MSRLIINIIKATPLNTSKKFCLNRATSARILYSTTIDNLSSKVIDQDCGSNLTPAMFAFLNRLNLKLVDKNLVLQMLTDKSYNDGKDANNNERLSLIGSKLIDLFVLEYYHTKYPNAPRFTLENLLSLHFGIKGLGLIGEQFGLTEHLRYDLPQDLEEEEISYLKKKVISKSVQAIIGALYHQHGGKVAREYIHKYLIHSRPTIDVKALLTIDEPKRHLGALLKRQGNELPESRLLKESGRLSNNPVFIVGVFSGSRKLGEDYGSSLKMAEFRACRDAIFNHYLHELKDFQLPSDTLFEDDVTYFPSQLGEAPIYLNKEELIK